MAIEYKRKCEETIDSKQSQTDLSIISLFLDMFFFFTIRGKGDYYRLGHSSDSHIRKPQIVEGLKGKKIVDVAVGALHCLAVTEQGQVRQLIVLSLT